MVYPDIIYIDMIVRQPITRYQEYIIEKEGEYPTSLWACVTTLYGVHDLCNDIHMLEASVLAVCGHVAKPQVQWSTNAGCCSC